MPFPVVDLVHLVALKLFAGGPRHVAGAVQVLQVNAPPPVGRLREVCSRHRLGRKLERVLAVL